MLQGSGPQRASGYEPPGPCSRSGILQPRDVVLPPPYMYNDFLIILILAVRPR